MTNTPKDAAEIASRLHRLTGLNQTQIDSLSLSLDPVQVDQINDSDLASLVNGTLPGLPANPAGGLPLGLPGATQGARFVGGTVSGPPSTGIFQARDYVLDGAGVFWICTAGGSPGTWVDAAQADALAAIPTPTAVKTGNYTATANQLIPVDTTSGNVTVTLPTAPADKTRVVVKHVVQGGTNTVTVARGGSSDVFNKTGGSTSLSLAYLNQAVTVQYKASGGIWYVVGDDLPVAAVQAVGTGTFVPQTQSLLDNNTNKRLFTASPPTRAPFTMSEWSSGPQTDGTYDHWFGIGWNAEVHSAPGGGTPASGQPAYYMGFEDGYRDPSSGKQGVEWYIAYWSPDHTSVQLLRPIFTRVLRDTNTDNAALVQISLGDPAQPGAFNVGQGETGPFYFTLTSARADFYTGVTALNGVGKNIQFALNPDTTHDSYLQFQSGGVTKWQVYRVGGASSALVLQDAANTRSQVTYTAGASAASALTRFGSKVTADSDVHVAATAANSSIYIDAAASNAGVLWFTDAGTNKFHLSHPNGDPSLYLSDDINGRNQAIFSAGASATTASAEFNSNVKVDGGFGANGQTPSTPVLPTGASKTVDQVIAALQTIGLVKQS